MIRFFILLAVFSLPSWLLGQVIAPPQSHLFSLKLKAVNSNYAVSDLRYLSSFNPLGYNNQPFFYENNLVMVSCAKPAEASEIYSLDLDQLTLKKLTSTQEPEYSPKPMPGKNGFSVVRVTHDTVQQLWYYPLDPAKKGQLLLKNSTNIGYYTWVNDSVVITFHVGNPSTLKTSNLLTNRSITFASDVGRCLLTGGHQQVFYVHKLTNQIWYLKSYDPELKRSQLITETLPGIDNFAMINDQLFLMAKGSSLYYFQAGTTQTIWTLIQDLAPYGIRNITRLAYQNETLVLVDQPN